MQKNERIEFEKDYDQTRWSLPNRDVGAYRQYGWLVFGFGLFATLFMVGWIAGPLTIGVKLIADGQWFGWLPVAFSMVGVFGLFFGLRLMTLGYRLTKNTTRSEVLISRGKLFSIEKLGWFDWRRKIKLEKIAELQIKDSSDLGKRRNRSASFPKDMTALVASTKNDSGFLVAVGYSEELIQELANQLAAEIGKEVYATTVGRGDSKPTAQQKNLQDIPVRKSEEVVKAPVKPANTKIVVQDHGEQRAYEIPATGFRGMAAGLFSFSCIWNLISVGAMLGMFKGGQQGMDWVLVIVVPCVFLAVGILILVFSIYLAKRSVMIGILDGQLFIERRSIFGDKWLEFAGTNIRRIYVGDSNMEVNDQPVRELKISLQGEDHPVGLLSQLGNDELDWLAYSLTHDLGIEYRADVDDITWQDEVNGKGELRLPAKSPIQLEEKVDGLLISVPRKSKQMAGVFVGMLVLIAGLILFWFIVSADIAGIVFVLAFGLLGAMALGIAMEFCSRRFEFEFDGERLIARRYSLFSQTVVEWQNEEIESIDVGFSGMKVNEKKSYQLQIKAGAKSFNGMTHWSTTEIAVIAGRLNQALQLEPVKSEVGSP